MKQSIKIKIQSMTDIITNSSSEVFIVSTSRTLDTLKEICQCIIGEKVNVDQVFEFYYECTIHPLDANGEVDMDADYEYDIHLTEDEYQNAHIVNETDVTIFVKAKDPVYNKFVDNLNTLISTYEMEVSYC